MIRTLINLVIASFIFFPTQKFSAHPKDFGLTAEDVWCTTSDRVRLHGWFLQAKDSKHCLLLFHGNADNIASRLPKAKEWVKRGVSVFLIDYRGYGQSKGKIELGSDLYLDAQAAFKWLKESKGLNPDQIILYGESIGSVPALELAIQASFEAVILEAPFTSLKEIAKIHYGLAPDIFLKDFLWDNESKIAQLKSPVFILHGTEDEIVPLEMGKRLFSRAPEPKQFLEVPKAHHNDISIVGGANFFELPFRFLLEQKKQVQAG